MPATGLNHASVCATDLEASTRFYVDVFGMEVLPTPNFGFPVRWLRVGAQQFHLFERAGGAPTYHHVAFTVPDFEALYARACELDCLERTTFGHFLYELPGDCVQLYLRDPAGNLIEVNAEEASRLPDSIRRDMRRLADVNPQDEENLRATLFLAAREG